MKKSKKKVEKSSIKVTITRKIGTKIFIALIAICIIPMLLLGLVSYNQAYSILDNKFKITTEQTLTEVNRGLDNYFEAMSKQIVMLSNNMDLKEIEAKPEFESFARYLLQNVKESNEEIFTVYYGTETRKTITYPEVALPADFNPTTRPWYADAVKNKGKLIFSEAYKDAATGNIIISISKAVEKDGQLVGVVSMDLNLDKLSQQLSGIRIGKEGYVFIADSKGTALAHLDKKLVGTDVVSKQSFWSEVKSKEKGFVEYKYTEDNSNKFASYTTNKKTGWKIVASMKESELLGDTNIIRNLTFLFIFAAGIFSIIIAIFISKGISKNVLKLKGSFERAADGDLTTRVIINSKDEFLELGNSFNAMMENISALTKNVEESSKVVLETSSILNAMTEEVSASINGVSQAMEEISKGTVEQARNAEQGALQINELASRIEVITESTKEMDSISSETNSLSNKGLEMVDTLVEKSSNTKLSTFEVNEIVKEVDISTEAISSITETITQITEQTNLLALNAAIEAARAGEAGRGFSVVAEEIRKLAERSRDSAKEISDIIGKIQGKSKSAVDAINRAEEFVQDQELAVEQTRVIFTEILKSINSLIDKVSEIRLSTVEMNDRKEEIVQEITNVSSISEETAAGTEEVSASAEEISATMDDFIEYAGKLKDLSSKLELELKSFKLS
ncbi:methyl-accepting chemotaxis protein [Clostridium sp. CX1]|uniref:methyl-accepting chemotaxis protein n=1 Tax=Clostridium sp. CX1 TaxID=2978346 RepID=UPI0021C1EA46|nr:methyl-accepting chemotaxis protein [Clostridium sp. CX1]MCT8976551.1 methyl-accepting chemotaxis protein [Clostridium sp. CX1]